MPPTRINLDANATLPLRDGVLEAMHPAFALGNPSSAHADGRRARQLLEDARDRVAGLLGAKPDEVVFTSGATEANNLAVLGTPTGHIVSSEIEHPCVVEPVRRRGDATWLPAGRDGRIAPATFAAAVATSTRLVTLMLVNHETGAIQPVADTVTAIRGVPLHCDASQAVGKISVNFHELGASTLSASGHKFGAPVGVGVLLVRSGHSLTPLTFGGHQQRGRRPGTEPVALTVGFATALELAMAAMAGEEAHRRALRERFLAVLGEAEPIVVNGSGLSTTLNVAFPGCRADLLLMALDLVGVSCSTGSACSSGSLLPSPVLRAMGVPDDVLRSSLRFSFDHRLTLDAVADAAGRVVAAVRGLRADGPGV
jgi:cysteine desulfurase